MPFSVISKTGRLSKGNVGLRVFHSSNGTTCSSYLTPAYANIKRINSARPFNLIYFECFKKYLKSDKKWQASKIEIN